VVRIRECLKIPCTVFGFSLALLTSQFDRLWRRLCRLHRCPSGMVTLAAFAAGRKWPEQNTDAQVAGAAATHNQRKISVWPHGSPSTPVGVTGMHIAGVAHVPDALRSTELFARFLARVDDVIVYAAMQHSERFVCWVVVTDSDRRCLWPPRILSASCKP